MSGLALALGFGIVRTAIMPVANPAAPPFQFITALKGQQVTTFWLFEKEVADQSYDARVVSKYRLKGNKRTIQALVDSELIKLGYRSLGSCTPDTSFYVKGADTPPKEPDRLRLNAVDLAAEGSKDSCFLTYIHPPSDAEYALIKLGRQIMISLSPR